VSGLDAELVRLGYKDSTMVWYRGCWRRLEKFFGARGVEEFSRDLALAWVEEACGFFGKGAGWHAQTDRCLLVQGRPDARRLRGQRGGAAPLFPRH
jgi:hypothetical protein